MLVRVTREYLAGILITFSNGMMARILVRISIVNLNKIFTKIPLAIFTKIPGINLIEIPVVIPTKILSKIPVVILTKIS